MSTEALERQLRQRKPAITIHLCTWTDCRCHRCAIDALGQFVQAILQLGVLGSQRYVLLTQLIDFLIRGKQLRAIDGVVAGRIEHARSDIDELSGYGFAAHADDAIHIRFCKARGQEVVACAIEVRRRNNAMRSSPRSRTERNAVEVFGHRPDADRDRVGGVTP